MANVAQIDDDWDPTCPTAGPAFLQANRHLERVLSTSPRRKPKVETVSLDFLGEKIEWMPDGGRDFPPAILASLERLIEFNGLANNWDSYGGRSLQQKAVGPALQLIFLSHQRGVIPNLVPLPTGGVGLRWNERGYEVEVDIGPDGTAEAILESEAGEGRELPAGTAIGEVCSLVEQSFRAA